MKVEVFEKENKKSYLQVKVGRKLTLCFE